jgi:hypothetical protein
MKNRLACGFLALSVVSLAACSETAGPDGSHSQVKSLVTLDIAMVSADALIDDLAELQLTFVGGLGGAFAAPPPDRTRTVTFYDAAGNEQEAHDGATTASIHIVSEFSGGRGRGNWSGSVSRERDMTISGLEGDETTRIANGTGNSTVSRSRHNDEDGDRSYDMSGTSLITDVVHGVPRDENRYPLSGTVTRDVTVVVVNGPNGDVTRNKHVVTTFDGTKFATLSVDGESFEVDLSTRDGRHPLRNRGR